MTEVHVLVLFFSLIPSGKTGIHKQLSVERIGDNIIEQFLPDGRVGREVDAGSLSCFIESESAIGIHDEELGQKKTFGRLPGYGFAGFSGL